VMGQPAPAAALARLDQLLLHSPLPATDFGAESPLHRRVQIVSASQLTEQLSVQETLQVAPLPQETLPLLPREIEQLACSQLRLPLSPVERVQLLPPRQFALQDFPHVPVQLFRSVQESEQLSVQPAASESQVQTVPASQEQALPLQVQPGPGQVEEAGADDPHPAANSAAAKRATRVIGVSSGWGVDCAFRRLWGAQQARCQTHLSSRRSLAAARRERSQSEARQPRQGRTGAARGQAVEILAKLGLPTQASKISGAIPPGGSGPPGTRDGNLRCAIRTPLFARRRGPRAASATREEALKSRGPRRGPVEASDAELRHELLGVVAPGDS